MSTDDFDERFDDLAAIAYRAAFRILGDREEARDVTQEALAKAYARWSKVAGYAEPWVARVAGNQALGVARKRGRSLRSCAVDPPAWLDPADAIGDRHRLAAALASLSPRQRDTVLLRFVADLSEADVARVLGCSAGTVKSQTHRALRRLRPLLIDSQLVIDPRSP